MNTHTTETPSHRPDAPAANDPFAGDAETLSLAELGLRVLRTAEEAARIERSHGEDHG